MKGGSVWMASSLDRLPTKDNLLKRGVLQGDQVQCVEGQLGAETAKHLFLI